MSDLPLLTRRVVALRDARDWTRLHTPRNPAASRSIAAAELLEKTRRQLEFRRTTRLR